MTGDASLEAWGKMIDQKRFLNLHAAQTALKNWVE